MTDHNDHAAEESTDQPKRGKGWRTVIAGVLLVGAGVAAGTAITAYAGGGWHHGGSRGAGHHGPFDAERARMRADHVVDYVAKTLSATEAQQREMHTVVGTFIDSIGDDVTEHRATRREMIALLSADSVDQAALQALRAQELSRADAVSERILDSLVELAEVLTPEQRAEVREHLVKFHD